MICELIITRHEIKTVKFMPMMSPKNPPKINPTPININIVKKNETTLPIYFSSEIVWIKLNTLAFQIEINAPLINKQSPDKKTLVKLKNK